MQALPSLRICYNFIKLSEFQKRLSQYILNGSFLVCAPYGAGKTVAILHAIKEHIVSASKHNKETKILYMSAQAFLSEVDLHFSPFLKIVEDWIKDICDDCHIKADIIRHTKFQVISSIQIDYILTKLNATVKFFVHLLKENEFNSILLMQKRTDKFDIIVLEETHALSATQMNSIMAQFGSLQEREVREVEGSKVWLVTNRDTSGLILEGSNFSDIFGTKNQENELHSLRNTVAIARLAESMNWLLPERYPTAIMRPNPNICDLFRTSYFSVPGDEERCNKIVEVIKRWLWIPKNQLLILDYEKTDLLKKLKDNDISISTYLDYPTTSETFLYLEESDPIEAIVAGAEWPVVVIQIKKSTMNSPRAAGKPNKRIISRATTKIYLFSDTRFDKEVDEIPPPTQSANNIDNTVRRT